MYSKVSNLASAMTEIGVTRVTGVKKVAHLSWLKLELRSLLDFEPETSSLALALDIAFRSTS
jgi:hypothetical protein